MHMYVADHMWVEWGRGWGWGGGGGDGWSATGSSSVM